MRLYPLSLLITAAVLIPNVLYLRFPPSDAANYGEPRDSLPFKIIERAGQASSFIMPLFFPLSFGRALQIGAWAVMGLALALYYAGWIRYFSRGRHYALLFSPMIGIPVPMAVGPVAYFLLSAMVLGSNWQAVAAVVLAIGHITITFRESVRVRGLTEPPQGV